MRMLMHKINELVNEILYVYADVSQMRCTALLYRRSSESQAQALDPTASPQLHSGPRQLPSAFPPVPQQLASSPHPLKRRLSDKLAHGHGSQAALVAGRCRSASQSEKLTHRHGAWGYRVLVVLTCFCFFKSLITRRFQWSHFWHTANSPFARSPGTLLPAKPPLAPRQAYPAAQGGILQYPPPTASQQPPGPRPLSCPASPSQGDRNIPCTGHGLACSSDDTSGAGVLRFARVISIVFDLFIIHVVLQSQSSSTPLISLLFCLPAPLLALLPAPLPPSQLRSA